MNRHHTWIVSIYVTLMLLSAAQAAHGARGGECITVTQMEPNVKRVCVRPQWEVDAYVQAVAAGPDAREDDGRPLRRRGHGGVWDAAAGLILISAEADFARVLAHERCHARGELTRWECAITYPGRAPWAFAEVELSDLRVGRGIHGG